MIQSMELAGPFEIWEYSYETRQVVVLTLDNGCDDLGHWIFHDTLILLDSLYKPGLCYRVWSVSKDLGWKKLFD